jgi:hypothetical protein
LAWQVLDTTCTLNVKCTCFQIIMLLYQCYAVCKKSLTIDSHFYNKVHLLPGTNTAVHTSPTSLETHRIFRLWNDCLQGNDIMLAQWPSVLFSRLLNGNSLRLKYEISKHLY